MATQTVEFQYFTGLSRRIFRNARLRGSWTANGRYTTDWTESPMQEIVGEDGCPMFSASVALDLADQHRTFRWGVVLDGPQGSNFWGIPTEVPDVDSVERYREFRLTGGATQVERYYFTYGRRLGREQTLHAAATRCPACGLPSGRPTRNALTSCSATPRVATSQTTAPGSMPRNRWSRWLGLRAASGRAARRDVRCVQEPSLHVPHRERAGTDGLPHRHLLAQPDRTGRDQSECERVAGYGRDARRDRQLQRGDRSRCRAPGICVDAGRMPSRISSRPRNSGRQSSRRAYRSRRGSPISSFTSCTSARSDSARPRQAI